MAGPLKKWYSWDSEYGQNSDLMLEALLCPEKHEPEKLSLLRLKLAAMGMDCIDAIKAVRDYRDLKIGFTHSEVEARFEMFPKIWKGQTADESAAP